MTIIDSHAMALTPELAPRLCARQLILERVVELVKHEAGTRSGEDIEALHDMRVASRRLRAALEIFEFCFPPKAYQRLYQQVRRVTRALGRARNADVAVDYFSTLLTDSDDLFEQFALQDVLRRLARKKTRCRARMQNELDKVQPASFSARFEKIFDAAAQTPCARPRGPRTARQLARRLLTQRLQEVFARQRVITGEENIQELHNLRIAVKKLRYVLESLDFAAGENLKENLRFFKKLQTVLGDLHDRDVFLEIIRKRVSKLRAQAFTTHLLTGYEMISKKIAAQRHEFYLEYVKLFGNARLKEWRERLVPPSPARKKLQIEPLILPAVFSEVAG
ncbi:MAG: CHAD domain-containing protein [candidate division KSB1 bacterium]|nr:CHAD domain-containing protein [candidate division KSB1 bacterium]MDZ7303356.1 CHAD domain-containing protein [candidate division KSB1 bacterium]MDZ7312326.1 CHAD domain-containing protein [candidate division KSB1 bacterium]